MRSPTFRSPDPRITKTQRDGQSIATGLSRCRAGNGKRTGPHFYRDLVLNLLSSLPYAIQKYRSTAMRRTIERELRLGDFEIVVCDFLASTINLPPGSRRPSVLFQHNVESTIWRRHFETQTNSAKREFFRRQWRRMLKYEQAACAEFDAVVAVSKVDRNLMLQEFGLADVYEVPTGVDTDFFRPLSSARALRSWCSSVRWIGCQTKTQSCTSLERFCRGSNSRFRM